MSAGTLKLTTAHGHRQLERALLLLQAGATPAERCEVLGVGHRHARRLLRAAREVRQRQLKALDALASAQYLAGLCLATLERLVASLGVV